MKKKITIAIILLVVGVGVIGVALVIQRNRNSKISQEDKFQYTVTSSVAAPGGDQFRQWENNQRNLCANQGGYFEAYGLYNSDKGEILPQYRCFLPLPDAGKTCTDGAQCLGFCAISEEYLATNYSQAEQNWSPGIGGNHMPCKSGACTGNCSRYEHTNANGKDYSISNGAIYLMVPLNYM